MHTIIYRLDARDTDWDVAHLFEHVVIDGFTELAERHGYPASLFGWLRGSTFDSSIIYLEGAFYDPAALALFESYMHELPQFSDRLIDISLRNIAAEERSNVTVTNRPELISAIEDLRKLPWTRGEASASPQLPRRRPIAIKRNAHGFRKIACTITASELTEPEQKVFLRLSLILTDVLYHKLYWQYTLYAIETGPVRGDEKGMDREISFSVPRGEATLRDYQRVSMLALQEFDAAANFKSLRLQFEEFGREPLWRDAALEYYKYTDVTTTTAEIARLATREVIAAVMAKVKVRVVQE